MTQKRIVFQGEPGANSHLAIHEAHPDCEAVPCPPFEDAFQSRMAVWRMDGKPRTARRFSVYQNCPLPTPEDRLFFILTSLKT